MAEGFKFCPECGAPQSAPAASEEPTGPMPAVDRPTGEVEVTPRHVPVTSAPSAPVTAAMPVTAAVPVTTVQPQVAWPAAPRVQVSELRYVPVEPPPDPAPLIVLAVLTAIAAVCAVVLQLYTLRTDQQTQRLQFEDIATNALAAALAGGLIIAVGSALAASARSVGAGLIGGAGLSLAALATMPVQGTDAVYRLFIRHQLGNGTFTHEVGFFVALGTIGLGIILFLVSISYATAEGSMHPGVRAAGIVGLLGTIAVVLGPLIPRHGAEFADNFSGDNGQTLSLLVRIGGIVLVLLAGVVGFLNNSSWGLGVGLGGISTWAMLWFTSQFEMGSHPLGPAGGNPPFVDAKPHGVTTVGVLVVLLAALVGIVIAITSRRDDDVVVRESILTTPPS